MKEEMTTLLKKYKRDKSEKNFRDILNAIEKYDKFLIRLNLDAQRWFDTLMDYLYPRNKGE